VSGGGTTIITSPPAPPRHVFAVGVTRLGSATEIFY